MKKTLMNDSMKESGYSQEEAYFHKDNLEKIEVIRASERAKRKGKSAEDAGEGGKIIPFPQPGNFKKAA